jgi:predicted deacylase
MMDGWITQALPVGEGNALELFVRSGEPGPCVAIIAGVHGDELEGILSVRRIMRELAATPLAGSIRALPVANPWAHAADARVSPVDRLNLARVFPGLADGKPTERIAHAITERVIRGSDAMIDLHSAGRELQMPLVCGWHDLGDEVSKRSAEMTRAFGTPLAWAHTTVAAGRTMSAARTLGVPAIYAECSGGGIIEGKETDIYVAGVRRVLEHLGVLASRAAEARSGIKLVRDSSGNIDEAISSSADGWMVRRAAVGEVVHAGAIVAEIFDSEGAIVETVRSPTEAIVMLLKRNAHVSRGEIIVMLAPAPVDWPG